MESSSTEDSLRMVRFSFPLPTTSRSLSLTYLVHSHPRPCLPQVLHPLPARFLPHSPSFSHRRMLRVSRVSRSLPAPCCLVSRFPSLPFPPLLLHFPTFPSQGRSPRNLHNPPSQRPPSPPRSTQQLFHGRRVQRDHGRLLRSRHRDRFD